MIGRWLQAMPEARKDLFLVTKDQPDIAPGSSSGNSTSGSRRSRPTTST